MNSLIKWIQLYPWNYVLSKFQNSWVFFNEKRNKSEKNYLKKLSSCSYKIKLYMQFHLFLFMQNK